MMGKAGCDYYFVNGPHAAEGDGPPGDDHSDIGECHLDKKEPSNRPYLLSLLLCLGYLRCLFRDSAQDGFI